jgi:hypothetical protein
MATSSRARRTGHDRSSRGSASWDEPCGESSLPGTRAQTTTARINRNAHVLCALSPSAEITSLCGPTARIEILRRFNPCMGYVTDFPDDELACAYLVFSKY